jgi:hypothetical protein
LPGVSPLGFVNTTVARLTSVSRFRSEVSAEAIARCGTASSHCTSGRQRARRVSAVRSRWTGYGVMLMGEFLRRCRYGRDEWW